MRCRTAEYCKRLAAMYLRLRRHLSWWAASDERCISSTAPESMATKATTDIMDLTVNRTRGGRIAWSSWQF